MGNRVELGPAGDGPLLFGRYLIETELGRGGMGRVLLAQDTKLRIQVALKLVPDELMSDPAAAEDLRREVLRGIALSHPGIVRTHTFEQDESGAAIVMEYVDGLTFAHYKEQQPGRCFDASDLLPWLVPFCEALDYAHWHARIVHRDLKPRNVMATRDGRLKVADFGISATLTDSQSRHTREGFMSGTPAYMSPQQARGKRPSHLDDVYSLGATIYDLLSSKPPFFRGRPDAILMQVMDEEAPSVTERRRDLAIDGKAPIPEDWEETIAACLAKDPAARPQSCGEVLARLRGRVSYKPAVEAALVPMQSQALVPVEAKPLAAMTARYLALARGKSRGGKFAALAVLAIAGLIALVAILTRQSGSGPVTGRMATPTPQAQTLPVVSSPTGSVRPAPFVNSLGMEFLPVPIVGGSTAGQRILFSVWETRVRDYQAFAEETGRNVTKPGYEQGADHAVVNVSWDDAFAFCAWLTDREQKRGTLSVDQVYRLPTDHEWSCAVEIGGREDPAIAPRENSHKVKNVYPWGPVWPPAVGAGNFFGEEVKTLPHPSGLQLRPTEALRGYRDAFPTTAPVGSFQPNVFGLYDLAGNAWEWCADWMDDAQKDRVLRGGSWRESLPITSSWRNSYGPIHRRDSFGFRCVLAARGDSYGFKPAPLKPSAANPAASPVAASTPVPKPLSETERWLAQAEAIYQPMWQKEVVAPYESGQEGLKKMILSALDVQIASASRAARLQDAVAFRNERLRAEMDHGIPGDDGDAPPAALKTLRATWRTQATQVLNEYRQHAQKVFAQYDKVLASNQTALTQARRLDEALLVQQRRVALKEEWAGLPRPRPAKATRELPFVNSLGMKFVPVPGTTVLMCIHETTRQNYAAFSAAVPGVDATWKSPIEVMARTPLPQGEDHPVISVSWTDAVAFCAWLSRREGRVYRLPTDREWNLAAVYDIESPETLSDQDLHAKLRDQYPWGTSDENDGPKYGNYDGSGDGYAGTAPVMSFLPNRLGLYDLGGNAQEWAGDTSPALGQQRSLRGCAYRNLGGYRHSDNRQRAEPDFRVPPENDGGRRVPGFRCVLQAPPIAPTAVPENSAGEPAKGALANATKESPFVNSLGMKFVPVPGTKVHFCIHETRRQDYATYAAEMPGTDQGWKVAKIDGFPAGHQDQHPVVGVNWDDAQAFCAWLSKKEGKRYRLPKDEEWSWAAGIGDVEKRTAGVTPEMLSGKIAAFPWGSQWPPPHACANFADSTWRETFPTKRSIEGYTDGFSTTSPVMSFKPNKLGLYDLAGNVWEWVADWGNESQQNRVLRGGSFLAFGGTPYSSTRFLDPPTLRRSNNGFRCVVEVPPP